MRCRDTETHPHWTGHPQVVPKSTNEERLKANLEVFSFELTAEQMARLDGLNCNHRYSLGWLPGHFYPL